MVIFLIKKKVVSLQCSIKKRKNMIKTKKHQLRVCDFNNKFQMCSFVNALKSDIDIINITHNNGLYTIFFLEEN
jgi:hypothetical protein